MTGYDEKKIIYDLLDMCKEDVEELSPLPSKADKLKIVQNLFEAQMKIMFLG